MDVTWSGEPAGGWLCGDAGAVRVGPERGQSSGSAPSELCRCEPGPEGRDLHRRGVSRGEGSWWRRRPPRRAAQSFAAGSSRKQAFLAGLLVLGIFKKFLAANFSCATSQLPERIESDHIT